MYYFNITGIFLLIFVRFIFKIYYIKMIKENDMYGYKIKINCLPEVVWACETTVDNYEWRNRNTNDMLEISFTKFGVKNITVNNNSYTLKNSALSCIMADEKRNAFCESGKPITIVSVAVRLSDFIYETREITDEDLYDEGYLILPAFLEDLPTYYELELTKFLHRIIKLSSGNSEKQKIALTSAFFELLYKVDEITRSQFDVKNSTTNYYIKKIDYIIASKFSEKITLSSVAAELNISPVYLSTIYKETVGVNFSEQVLNIRMKHAEKLLLDQNIPTAKVAELCGFCDESHFRKRFKQFFGLNVREYRQIKSGLTLYHDKPIRKSSH